MNLPADATGRPASPWFAALSMGVAAAFLLGGYEFIRSTTNTLFKNTYGAEHLPVVMALMPLGLVTALWGYGKLLSRLGPRRTLLATSGLSALCFLVALGALQAGFKPAAGVLYILREVYVVLLIEQYWSFLNSTLSDSDARRFNGPICGLGSLGSILGAMGTAVWSMPWGLPTMIVIGVALILPAAIAADRAFKRCGEPVPKPEEPHGHGALALSLFKTNRMLPLLLVVIMATQVLSTMLDLALQHTLQTYEPRPEEQNALSGWFFAWLNAAAALGQFIVAPLLLRFASLTLVHLIIPLIHLCMCAVLLDDPSFASAGLAYMLFKALDYSVFRAAKEVLYVPYSFDVRYRAKEVIDVFGYRMGKGGTSLVLALLKNAGMALSVAACALTGAVAAAVWLAALLPAIKPRKSETTPDG